MHVSHIRYAQHGTDCGTNRTFLSILFCQSLRFFQNVVSRRTSSVVLSTIRSVRYSAYVERCEKVARSATGKTSLKNNASPFPRAVAPEYIVECHHTFTAQGHNAATELQFQTTNFALGEWQQPNCLLLRGRGLTPSMCGVGDALTGKDQARHTPRLNSGQVC